MIMIVMMVSVTTTMIAILLLVLLLVLVLSLVLVLLPSPSLLVMLWKSFKHRKLFSFPALPTRTAPASGSALAQLRLQQMDQPPTCRCPAAQVVLQTHPPATPGPVHVPA